MLFESVARNALGLALFAALTVGVIAVTELVTRDAIAEQRARAQQRALLAILGEEGFDNAILEDVLPIEAGVLGLREDAEAYVARKDGAAVALVVPLVAPDGYSGAIRMLLGIRVDGVIAGLRILEHRETPGLGDAIEARKSDWILGFAGRSLADPGPGGWAVRKDGGEFDAFTGATITPRAVVAAVHDALQWYRGVGRRRLEEVAP